VSGENSKTSGLPFERASDLKDAAGESPWLVENLWAEEAVGILGGEPKCCKSFLALDVAVGVASGKSCLRRFPVHRTGPVLLYPAEDALGVVRQRLLGICAASQARLEELPLYVITAPRLLLDLPQDREGLRATVAALRPRLLILDPFIRLHRADENASKEVAPLLGFLRELQRQFHLAVMLVHHVRKRSGKDRPGQALRGSSDLHGWGDSNLYMRRKGTQLTLAVEHRAAAAMEDITLELKAEGAALALATRGAPTPPQPLKSSSPDERILLALHEATSSLTTPQLRKQCGLRTATLYKTLSTLRETGQIIQTTSGYSAGTPLPNTSRSAPPIGSTGSGSGKYPTLPQTQLESLFSDETQAGSAGTQPAQG
jgi:hypothetical protein